MADTLLEEATRPPRFQAYSRVLVPLDGSSFSEAALPIAVAVTRKGDAIVEAVHVAHREEEREEFQRYLSNLSLPADASRRVLPPPEISVAHSLLDYHDSVANTLLVMATHGRSGLAEAAMGSVATRIVQQSHSPVLLYRPVRKATLARVFETIVVPLDGSEFAEEVLTFAGGFARWLGAGVDVVQVVDDAYLPGDTSSRDVLDSSYVVNRAQRLHSEFGCDVAFEVLHGSAGPAICDYTQQRLSSILAMATHGREGLAVTALGSVTRECLRHSQVPVLAFQPLSGD